MAPGVGIDCIGPPTGLNDSSQETVKQVIGKFASYSEIFAHRESQLGFTTTLVYFSSMAQQRKRDSFPRVRHDERGYTFLVRNQKQRLTICPLSALHDRLIHTSINNKTTAATSARPHLPPT